MPTESTTTSTMSTKRSIEEMNTIYADLVKRHRWMNPEWAKQIFIKRECFLYSCDYRSCLWSTQRVFFKTALKYYLRTVIENGEVERENIAREAWRLAKEHLDEWRRTKKIVVEEEKSKIDHDNALRAKLGRMSREEEIEQIVKENREEVNKSLKIIYRFRSDLVPKEGYMYERVQPTKDGYIMVNTHNFVDEHIPLCRHAVYSGSVFKPNASVYRYSEDSDGNGYWRVVGRLKVVD